MVLQFVVPKKTTKKLFIDTDIKTEKFKDLDRTLHEVILDIRVSYLVGGH